jgi:hypothetical protein
VLFLPPTSDALTGLLEWPLPPTKPGCTTAGGLLLSGTLAMVDDYDDFLL